MSGGHSKAEPESSTVSDDLGREYECKYTYHFANG